VIRASFLSVGHGWMRWLFGLIVIVVFDMEKPYLKYFGIIP